LDEEKSKHVTLAQQNGFGSAKTQSLRCWETAQLRCSQKCNKYDLTAAHKSVINMT
jgi:hypothetical protein